MTRVCFYVLTDTRTLVQSTEDGVVKAPFYATMKAVIVGAARKYRQEFGR